jgi:hypothetical protein
MAWRLPKNNTASLVKDLQLTENEAAVRITTMRIHRAPRGLPMRRLALAVVLALGLLAPVAFAPSEALACDTYVSGYYRSDGTYVSGHYRSCSNSTTLDNWTTRGNSNPYTGAPGYRSPYSPSSSYCRWSWSC